VWAIKRSVLVLGVGLCGCNSLLGLHDPRDKPPADVDAPVVVVDAAPPIDAPLDAFMTSYTASAVRFDGTDYLKVSGPIPTVAAFNGAPNNSRKGVFSVWLKFEGGDGNDQNISAATLDAGNAVGLFGGVTRLGNSGRIQFSFNQCQGVNFGQVLVMQTTHTYTTANGWFHLAAAWDLDAPTNPVQIYANGSDDLDRSSVGIDRNNAAYICYNADNWYVGGTGGPNGDRATLDADVADMYSMFGTSLDLSSLVWNFRSRTTGKPINLGPNCVNGYNGIKPIACFSGNDGGSWKMNKGTGGGMNFSGNGNGLAAATTSPSS
jgi:hypothetical protein